MVIKLRNNHGAQNCRQADPRLSGKIVHVVAETDFRLIGAGTVKHHQAEAGQKNHHSQQ